LEYTNILRIKIRPVQAFFICIIFFCGLFIFFGNNTAEGAVFDYHGTRFFYGDSSWTHVGPDPADRYQWFNASYMVGKNMTDWLSLESQIGAGYLQTENYDDSPSIEWRVLLAFKTKYAYLNLGGGLAYLFNTANLPDLADTDIYGILSGSIGLGPLCYRRGDTLIEMTLGYSVEHISAPFHHNEDHGDVGWNVGGVEVKITWKF